MTDHVLKTLPEYWDAVASGDKTFEVRRNDRGFQLGDILILRRQIALDAPSDLRRRVTYILSGGQFGIDPEYVVLGLANEQGSE